MLKPTLGLALLCAAATMPAGANRIDPESAVSPLAVAIAAQGDQALRDIRRQARICLRSLKPAPLDNLVKDVRFAAPPAEVVEASL